MVNFNEYINEIDFSEFKKHFLSQSRLKRRIILLDKMNHVNMWDLSKVAFLDILVLIMLVTNLLSVIVLPKILCVITHH